MGSYIAQVCSSMGMEIIAFDPFVNQTKAETLRVQIVSLETLLKQSTTETHSHTLIAS